MKIIFKYLSILIFLLTLNNYLISQIAPNKYYIEFTDKNHNNYNLDTPESFLSARAIQRRINQSIDINYSDLPVSNKYIDSLKHLGIQVLNTSKWFNSAIIYTEDNSQLDILRGLSFVRYINKFQSVPEYSLYKDNKYPSLSSPTYFTNKNISSSNYYDYGYSAQQVSIHNGEYLHNNGYRGAGIMIAITDAGFEGLPSLSTFDSIYNSNRVICTRNFVHGGTHVYGYHSHGTRVFSTIGANYPGQLVGTAPEADFVLLMSEDPDSEHLIEEYNWASAAEFADSIGADIINVSLGYLNFDFNHLSHTYSDLNGRTSVISQAASLAMRKGMIVVVAASNMGQDSIHHWICTPADTDSILTLGAISADSIYAPFSSIGPSYDGRIKPDLVAVGSGTYHQDPNGDIVTGNGTSFASPLIAGLAACLWQKFPNKTNIEIIKALQQSGHLYDNPNYYLGYGIPNMKTASDLLTTNTSNFFTHNNIHIFPNPCNSELNIQINLQRRNIDKLTVQLSDMLGKFILIKDINLDIDNTNLIKIDNIDNLESGFYILSLITNEGIISKKIVVSK